MRGIVCDAHGSHALIRASLNGQVQGLNAEMVGVLAQAPFFSELQHVPVPPNALPRFPMKICLHRGEVVFGLSGPCVWDVHCAECLEFDGICMNL